MKYTVIGIPNNSTITFSDEIKSLLPGHRLFSGGKRHYELVKEHLPSVHEWIDIKSDVQLLVEQFKERNESIVVFASGDPLFFGFANSIKKYHHNASIKIYPYFNSLQLLCHRCNIPYHPICNVSVHGRSWKELDCALIEQKELIGVLTDIGKSPAAIAQRLLDYNFDQYTLIAGENLEGATEKVTTLSLKEAAQSDFHPLNCVLLIRQMHKSSPFGIPDESFAGLPGRPNMITKMPVRLVSLSQLDLKNCQTFWDIGFCTASVSIEAKRQFPWLDIVAIEKREECDVIFDINTKKHSTPGIKKVMGDFFDVPPMGPPPSAVFIGGHGNRLGELIHRVDNYLLPKGRLVFNSVREDSRVLFIETIRKLSYTLLTPITIAVDEHNPITILTAEKK